MYKRTHTYCMLKINVIIYSRKYVITFRYFQTKEEDIKRRQDYLKARRDELVALKKEVRSQRLEMNATRPSSARVVADATIKGEQELDVGQSLEPSILQVRKALAARLKAEVVHK